MPLLNMFPLHNRLKVKRGAAMIHPKQGDAAKEWIDTNILSKVEKLPGMAPTINVVRECPGCRADVNRLNSGESGSVII